MPNYINTRPMKTIGLKRTLTKVVIANGGNENEVTARIAQLRQYAQETDNASSTRGEPNKTAQEYMNKHFGPEGEK